MGMTWADLLGMYMQYRAADKAGDQKPQYSISPQMDELFKRMMGLVDYSPTRDYISSYADSFIKSTNAPGGMASWKPTYQTDYMKNQPALPNTAIDITKVGNGVMNGDKNNLMPWNYGYTGPGIGGKMTKPPGAQGGLYGGAGGGGRGPMTQDMNGADDMGGGWSSDYYRNPYNTNAGNNPFGPSDYDRITNGNGNEPRDQFGQLITTMNSMSPAARDQYMRWWGGLTETEKLAEHAKQDQMDQFVAKLGGQVGGAIKGVIKGDPVGFAAALMTAKMSGGMSLVTYFGGAGLDKLAGNAWEGIKGWFTTTYGSGGSSPITGTTPYTPPSGPPNSPWGNPGGKP